jgi:hypothetical protein
MIVKMMRSREDEYWKFYEGTSVGFSRRPASGWLDENGQLVLIGGENIEEEWLPKHDPMNPQTSNEPVVCLVSFVDSDGTSRNIYTDMPVYLMNDNGRTIESINGC